MKKLLTAFILTGIITSAQAIPTVIPAGHVVPPSSAYQAGYNSGYDSGKEHAYNRVARATLITVGVVVVGTLIYELGKESRWTTSQNGIGYRF